jgi:hypothetical protein
MYTILILRIFYPISVYKFIKPQHSEGKAGKENRKSRDKEKTGKRRTKIKSKKKPNS